MLEKKINILTKKEGLEILFFLALPLIINILLIIGTFYESQFFLILIIAYLWSFISVKKSIESISSLYFKKSLSVYICYILILLVLMLSLLVYAPSYNAFVLFLISFNYILIVRLSMEFRDPFRNLFIIFSKLIILSLLTFVSLI